jgi:hypothetical protein
VIPDVQQIMVSTSLKGDKKLILDCMTLEDEDTMILQHVWNQ